MEQTLHTANADAVIHMRLFRAQRNLYISGFSLFLYFIIRRMATLISMEAQLQASAEAAMKQAQSASDVAKTLLEADDDGEPKQVTLLKETIEELKTQLEKVEVDRDTLKKQAEGLQKEYDRLADQLNKVEWLFEKRRLNETSNKKNTTPNSLVEQASKVSMTLFGMSEAEEKPVVEKGEKHFKRGRVRRFFFEDDDKNGEKKAGVSIAETKQSVTTSNTK